MPAHAATNSMGNTTAKIDLCFMIFSQPAIEENNLHAGKH
jgi:hypothetical protein